MSHPEDGSPRGFLICGFAGGAKRGQCSVVFGSICCNDRDSLWKAGHGVE